jgi:hypothetical protein
VTVDNVVPSVGVTVDIVVPSVGVTVDIVVISDGVTVNIYIQVSIVLNYKNMILTITLFFKIITYLLMFISKYLML